MTAHGSKRRMHAQGGLRTDPTESSAASGNAASDEQPRFEVFGDLSDEGIEALARLLLSVADQDVPREPSS
jgi:hypothetical protein